MGLFSGLEKLGLENLSNMEVFDSDEKDKEKKDADDKESVRTVSEEEVLYDKSYKCPVCDHEFKSKSIRTGKVKLVSVDTDLRPRYQTADCIKYDCIVCDKCGYAALTRYFNNLTMAQAKLISQNITPSFQGINTDAATYSYEEAILRYQLALANSVVKKARVSERAYICLKLAWLVRGMTENLDVADIDYMTNKEELEKAEEQYTLNAYEGFKTAMSKELFPICGMDESTFIYVTADLARRSKDYQTSLKLISEIITSRTTSAKVKDRARELKDLIKQETKPGV